MTELRKYISVDTNRNISLNIPIEFGNEVEVIVRRKGDPESLEKQSNTGFVLQLINDPKEDVWNDL
ncbi:hypothetical protein [Leptospira ilyithenensis]|uniref:Uncharacterized protein n=1 Tax=Leptospira ilyithenensis TaxID=2484901 RepID=A0A4R9LKB2_9LEPT|nr:hypothetical protein [Leptospira ilyithenensis]TGN08026.1 hypothetical protein EHS11_13900 [Leptospira ilyithenensis]